MEKKIRVRVDTRLMPNDRMRLEELARYLGVSVSSVTRVAIRLLLEKAYNSDGYIKDEIRQAIFTAKNK